MTPSSLTAIPFAEAAERVKAHLDIVEVIGRTVALKKRGRNYLGLCPFHKEKTPSFNVNRERGMFKCFGCGEGGDTLAFLMRHENKNYRELIIEYAEVLGFTINLGHGSNTEWETEQKLKENLLTLHHKAVEFYQHALTTSTPEAQAVQAYLKDRGLSLEDCQQFGIGFAPPGWDNLVQQYPKIQTALSASPNADISIKLLEVGGLANVRQNGDGYYDRFRNRLMIPIHDTQGRPIAFGGRALSPEDIPKYLNSPETAIYKKHTVLYGLFWAREAIREQHAVFVMEGYFDVISAHLAGITNAVASCGTALSEEQIRLLTRVGAETIYLAFDSDEAGLKAALSGIERIEQIESSSLQKLQSLKVKVVLTPEGKDPDEYFKHHGGDAFLTHVEQHAKDFRQFQLEMAIRHCDVSEPEGRIEAVNQVVPILARMTQPIVQSEFRRLMAQTLGVSDQALELEIQRYSRQKRGTDRGSDRFADRREANRETSLETYKRDSHFVTNIHQSGQSHGLGAILNPVSSSFNKTTQHPAQPDGVRQLQVPAAQTLAPNHHFKRLRRAETDLLRFLFIPQLTAENRHAIFSLYRLSLNSLSSLNALNVSNASHPARQVAEPTEQSELSQPNQAQPAKASVTPSAEKTHDSQVFSDELFNQFWQSILATEPWWAPAVLPAASEAPSEVLHTTLSSESSESLARPTLSPAANDVDAPSVWTDFGNTLHAVTPAQAHTQRNVPVDLPEALQRHWLESESSTGLVETTPEVSKALRQLLAGLVLDAEALPEQMGWDALSPDTLQTKICDTAKQYFSVLMQHQRREHLLHMNAKLRQLEYAQASSPTATQRTGDEPQHNRHDDANGNDMTTMLALQYQLQENLDAHRNTLLLRPHGMEIHE